MKIGILIVLSFLLFLMGKIYYDTNSIEIKHYRINCSYAFALSPQPSVLSPMNSPAASLAEVLNGLKVAHLSDLHIGGIGLREEKVLEILAGEKPDLVFITGDSVGFQSPYDSLVSFFGQLKAPLGVYAVLGNTEYSNENGSCVLCHEERSRVLRKNPNPIFLRNSNLRLDIKGKILNLIGVNDPVDKKSDLIKGLDGIDPSAPTILLAHSPEIFEEASGAGIDLFLTGHTHGGQIFLTRYLQKIVPLDKALNFIDGFFQKGKTLMYVSRGIGTSFLPFRLGIKPEITFFTFSNQKDASDHGNDFSISNNPPLTTFNGFSLSSLMETFNLFSAVTSNSATRSHGDSNILFDFESEAELKRLNWECHKWFEISEKFVTSGKHSLKAILPPGQYPGIAFKGVRENWSGYGSISFDIGNPSGEEFTFHIRIDDNKSGWEYANRYDVTFNLKPGMNHVSIPTQSIRTNIKKQPLNLKQIKRMMTFIPDSTKQRELYIDNIRLE